jgi:hypothetical protein
MIAVRMALMVMVATVRYPNAIVSVGDGISRAGDES